MAQLLDRHGRPLTGETVEKAADSGAFLVPFQARNSQRIDPFTERGTTGLRQYGGWVFEEWNAKLQGRQGAQAYREFMDNDPVAGAVLFLIRWMMRAVEWRVEEGTGGTADAEFLESCMHDMEHTWGDFIVDSSSFLGYGWAVHEEVYKRRQGPQPGPDWEHNTGDATTEDDAWKASSKFSDGKIGWRKLAGRAQETLLHWNFTGYGDPTAMVQLDWHGGEHTIPFAKSLLFRTTTARNNPEGRSILRNAITSYWAVKHIKALEGIGIERDLAGVPVMTAPESVNIWAPANTQLLNKLQTIVSNLRNDEYAGIVKNFGYELELMTTGGSRQFDTDKVVRRYRQDIAMSMLADFVLLGQDAVGSFALAEVKGDMFGVALEGILDLICETLNRTGVPRLLALNGVTARDEDDLPKIAHGSARKIDLDRVGSFLQAISLAGAPIPWTTEIIEALFKDAGLPANFDQQQSAEGLPGQRPDPMELTGRESVRVTEGAPGQTAKPAAVQKGAGQAGGHPKAGRTIEVGDMLSRHADQLAAQLDSEIAGALDDLGRRAGVAYETSAIKAAPSRAMLRRIVDRVLRSLNLPAWIDGTLRPILRNHAARVMGDTQQMLRAEIELEVGIGDRDAERIEASAGEHLGMRDIEPQVRQAIMTAIRQGLDAGESPSLTAQKIRSMVPAGRFVHAGSKHRARLIARDQTLRLQRGSALAAYRSNPRITHVELRDGIFGPPRSDAHCIARDGQVVPVDEADAVHPYHPQCTLGFLPVVSPSLVAPPLPELVAA
ncbi:MAG: phage portal protein family protein [Acidiferrobacteraceae bacterium]